MRRALLAVIAGGTLLAGTACDSDASSPEAAAPAPATTSAAPTASPAPDYSADTKQVCDELKTVYQGELRDFGAAMGKMITYKEAKQTTEAQKAEDTAAAELKAVALKIRKETAVAQDPEIKTAGAESAAKLERSAKDRKYMDRVKSLKDLNGSIERQLNEWLTPVSGYCGA
jgi:hypothetical protein